MPSDKALVVDLYWLSAVPMVEFVANLRRSAAASAAATKTMGSSATGNPPR